jgi:NAD(P)-dependent dehydrogenase (short-subunit alcohol dehydrogenase family)
MVDFDLTDKVAIVTGGSRGLGHSTVLGLARAGADVVIASRKLDNCKAVAEEVETTTGRKALPVACHVGHWDQLGELVDAAYDRFGKVDVLVNNAGMSPLYPDLMGVTEELYDKVFDVNLKGPFRLAVLVGTRMVQSGNGGSIINVSSIGSLRPYGGIVPYAAAKAGVNAMTVGLSDAFGPTVRVNCVIPGSFATDVVRHWDEATKRGAADRPALKRIGDPDEIVGAVLYFASDASSYTTGALLRVDGGAV